MGKFAITLVLDNHSDPIFFLNSEMADRAVEHWNELSKLHAGSILSQRDQIVSRLALYTCSLSESSYQILD